MIVNKSEFGDRFRKKTEGWNIPQEIVGEIISGRIIPFRIHQIRSWLPVLYEAVKASSSSDTSVIDACAQVFSLYKDWDSQDHDSLAAQRAEKVSHGISIGKDKQKILDRLGSTLAEKKYFENGVSTQVTKLLKAKPETRILVGEIFSLVCEGCAIGEHCHDLKKDRNEDHELVDELKSFLDKYNIEYKEVLIDRGFLDGQKYYSRSLLLDRDVFLAIVMSRMIAETTKAQQLDLTKHSLIPSHFMDMRASTFDNTDEEVFTTLYKKSKSE